MNYYDELIEKLAKLIRNKDYEKAKAIIVNELSLAYVPKDIEDKLNEYLSIIKEATYVPKSLTIEDIEVYLYKDPQLQLIAVDALDRLNIREHLDICAKYLKSAGFKNAKVLLIDTLIKQDIDYEFAYVNEDLLLNFNPRQLKTPEKTAGFIEASSILNRTYMKEPSLLQMGMDLLYKECLLYLPKQANTREGEIFANKISKYIDEAFSAKQVLK